jgi:hypothetical protein
MTDTLQMMKAGKSPLKETLGVMLIAKGSKWDVTGTGLKVQYDGGSATFSAKPGTSKAELMRAADVFNAISHTAETVSVEKYSRDWLKKPAAIEKPSGGTGTATSTQAPASSPDSRSTPALDKLR